MSQSSDQLNISKPGSLRLFLGIIGAFVGTLVASILIGSDLTLTDAEKQIALISVGFMTTLCVACIASGWKRTQTSGSEPLSRLDALALGRYVQDSPGAKTVIRDRLRDNGAENLADLTYNDVMDISTDIREAKEADLIMMQS